MWTPRVTLTILCTILCSYAKLKSADASGIVACYYTSWSIERPDAGRFGVSDLPTDLCTHISYAFLDLTIDGELIIPDQLTIDGKTNNITSFIALKEENPDLNLLIAIGGWSAGSLNFSAVVNDDTLRSTFANNLLTFIEDNGFDGLDLCWDYPSDSGGLETDKVQYGVLMKELKALFGDKYLLTAGVGVTQSRIDLSFDVAALNEYLDYINLQTYEYHGSWDDVTGVNAPLYAQTTDAETENLNVDSSVKIWLENGASASKLVLGFGAFGKTFTLSDPEDNATGAASSGAGAAGPYSEEAGVLTYYEICGLQANDSSCWTIKEESGNYVYAYQGTLWVGYDNPSTIYAKGQYAKSMGLAGIMVWAVDEDDFGALCGAAYPLLTQGVAGYNSE